MSPPPVRVGLIGYGLAGAAFHAPFVGADPELALAAIVTRDEERRARARSEHPRAELLDDADAIFSRREAFDLVVVAAPNRLHVELAGAALRAGLPVVVDKPLAPTAAEARALAEEARAAGLLLTVFHNRRWDGDLLTVRRLVDEGRLGRVLRFESRFERRRPAVGSGWRELADPEEAGGVLYDLGSHLVDQALLLFGPAEDVYAELEIRRPGARAVDDAFLALTHASGVRSHLWMSAVTARLGPRLRVLGDRAGYIKFGLDVQEAALRAGARPGGPGWGEEPAEHWGTLGVDGDTSPVPTAPGCYQRFYRGVAHALLRGGPPPVSAEEATATLEVLDTARRSAVRTPP